ncbi:MAG: hypothetical protein ACD_62C00085G0005 [uncultured bacterium]|nr:MAG: hypothetical protein ACD_62C00085G0005 [uncultured bacterium]
MFCGFHRQCLWFVIVSNGLISLINNAVRIYEGPGFFETFVLETVCLKKKLMNISQNFCRLCLLFQSIILCLSLVSHRICQDGTDSINACHAQRMALCW